MIGRRDHPEFFRGMRSLKNLLRLGQRDKLILRGMDCGKWNWSHLIHNARDTEGRLVGNGMRYIDDGIFQSPAKLIQVGKTKADHSPYRLLGRHICSRK